jgi:hypothetical protein
VGSHSAGTARPAQYEAAYREEKENNFFELKGEQKERNTD